MASTDSSPFDIKGGLFTLAALRLHSTDLQAIEAGLAAKVAQAPALLDRAPMVIQISELDGTLDLRGLLKVMRRHGVLPVAVQGGDEALQSEAIRNRLGVLAPHKPACRVEAEKPAEASPPPDLPSATPAKIVTYTLRSGQQVYAPGGDLVVVASVHRDAELIADGNIHVYGRLSGKALAGVKGNEQARIFALEMDPQLVSIAGIYKVVESMGAERKNRPGQCYLQDGHLMIGAL
jgi:septum site-determining protein MinC